MLNMEDAYCSFEVLFLTSLKFNSGIVSAAHCPRGRSGLVDEKSQSHRCPVKGMEKCIHPVDERFGIGNMSRSDLRRQWTDSQGETAMSGHCLQRFLIIGSIAGVKGKQRFANMLDHLSHGVAFGP